MIKQSGRRALKDLLKQAAIVGGLEAISRLRLDRLFPHAAGRGLIFTLHHVRPKTETAFRPNAHLEVTPDYLDTAIAVSLKAGLTPIRLEDLPERLADRSDERRFVCFTLDDGYRNNVLHAAPIFRRHGVPYTIFITPGFVDRSATLWWETAAELIGAHPAIRLDFGSGFETMPTGTMREKALAFRRFTAAVDAVPQRELIRRLDEAALRAGIDPRAIVERELMDATEIRSLAADPLVSFGGHTMTHPRLTGLPAGEVREEIERSVVEVAALTGRAVTTFAYPYGSREAAGVREYEAAKAAGLKLAVTTGPGMLTDETLREPMAVPRVSLNGLYQKKRYVGAMISGLPLGPGKLVKR